MALELTFRGCIFLVRIARGRWYMKPQAAKAES